MCKDPYIFISNRGQNKLCCSIVTSRYTLENEHTDSTYSYQVTMKAFGDISIGASLAGLVLATQ